jgi:CelD/BcsL family acetyltransferase involved in cellulose biosynthesis
MNMPRDLTMDCSAGTPRTAAGTVEVIRNLAELDALRAQWDELFAVSPTAAPPLRWEWVRTWWQIYGPHYGDRGRGLRVFTVRRHSRLVGVLPLYIRRRGNSFWAPRRLGFISTGAAEFEETGADYLDLLHFPDDDLQWLPAIASAIRGSSEFKWDELDLTDLSPRSPLLSLGTPKNDLAAITMEQGAGFRSDLTGGFDEYLRRISPGARAEARRLLREVDRSGAIFEVARDVEQAKLFFAQMVALHHRRWRATGRSGSFATRHAEFHSRLASSLVLSGSVLLVRLSHGGEPYAVAYGHRIGSTYHCLQRGVAIKTEPIRSPGTATLLLLMAHLAERGVTCYDHLLGANSFKERYATEKYSLMRLRAERPTIGTAVSHVGQFANRARRKATHLITRGGFSAKR